MRSLTTGLLAVSTLFSSTLAAAVQRRAGASNVAVYYGQGPSQKVLGEFCQDDTIDIIPIGFVTVLPNNDRSVDGYPGLDFGNQCGNKWTDEKGQVTGMFDKCGLMIPEIKKCQQAGKKILLSIGGASQVHFQSDKAGSDFADFMWKAFGPRDASYKGPRPFGDDIVIDGFDFDIETLADKSPVPVDTGIAAAANRFRTLKSGIMITAAPQCIVPDRIFQNVFRKSLFDAIFVQFYNTPECSAKSSFDSSFGKGISFDAWVNWLKTPGNNLNPGMKVYIGLPGSEQAVENSYFYLKPEQAQILINKYRQNSMFGGVMIWEATRSDNNQIQGNSYAKVMKRILQNNWPPSTTTTTVTTTTTKTTTTTPSTTTTSSKTTTTSSTTTTTTTSSTTTTTSSTTTTTSPTTTTTSSTTTTTTATSPTTTTTSSTTTTTTSASTTPSTTTTTTSISTTPSTTTTTSESTISSTITTTPSTTTTGLASTCNVKGNFNGGAAFTSSFTTLVATSTSSGQVIPTATMVPIACENFCKGASSPARTFGINTNGCYCFAQGIQDAFTPNDNGLMTYYDINCPLPGTTSSTTSASTTTSESSTTTTISASTTTSTTSTTSESTTASTTTTSASTTTTTTSASTTTTAATTTSQSTTTTSESTTTTSSASTTGSTTTSSGSSTTTISSGASTTTTSSAAPTTTTSSGSSTTTTTSSGSSTTTTSSGASTTTTSSGSSTTTTSMSSMSTTTSTSGTVIVSPTMTSTQTTTSDQTTTTTTSVQTSTSTTTGSTTGTETTTTGTETTSSSSSTSTPSVSATVTSTSSTSLTSVSSTLTTTVSSSSMTTTWGQWPTTTPQDGWETWTTSSTASSWDQWTSSKTRPNDWQSWTGSSSTVWPTTKVSNDEWFQWSTTSPTVSSSWAVWPTTTAPADPWETWPVDSPGKTITVITTSYVDVCPTGYTTIALTTTITIKVTQAAGPAPTEAWVWPTNSEGCPSGFYVTETVCSVGCGDSPKTVTVTLPTPAGVITQTLVPQPVNTASWSGYGQSSAPVAASSSVSWNQWAQPSASVSASASWTQWANASGMKTAPTGPATPVAGVFVTSSAWNSWSSSPVKEFKGAASSVKATGVMTMMMGVAGLIGVLLL